MVVIYPEWVDAQLRVLDERIEAIYQAYENVKVKPDEAMKIKKDLYEQTKAFVDEKVRLISNSCPKYVVEKRINLINKDEETLKTLMDIQRTCHKFADCTGCPYCTHDEYICCLKGVPSDWSNLEKVFKGDRKEG